MYRIVLRDRPVVLIDGWRTPIGSLNGALADRPAPDLAASCLRRLGEDLQTAETDKLILGCVLEAGMGQAPARQALIQADWSVKIPAFTVNQVCGSGLQSVLTGLEGIRAGAVKRVVAGGMESMTRAPHMVDHRRGKKLGDDRLRDHAVRDGLWCSTEDEHMGIAAERIASRYNLTREDIDELALRSQRRATKAEEEGRFDGERITLDELDRDEDVRPDTSMEALAKLPTVFKEDGLVTPGNAPGLNDGAAVLALASPRAVSGWSEQEDVFRVEGYSVTGLEPGNLFETPAQAIQVLLEQSGDSLEDFDRVEINEAFAAQFLANCHRLEFDPEKVNRWGGAVAMGHPLGASGTRILLTLMNQLRTHDEERGLAAICMGGGNGIAVAIRRVSLSDLL